MAEQIYNQSGLTLAAGVNIYIKAVNREKIIPFNLTLNENKIVTTSKSEIDKEKSFNAIKGILEGYEINLEKEREERISGK